MIIIFTVNQYYYTLDPESSNRYSKNLLSIKKIYSIIKDRHIFNSSFVDLYTGEYGGIQVIEYNLNELIFRLNDGLTYRININDIQKIFLLEMEIERGFTIPISIFLSEQSSVKTFILDSRINLDNEFLEQILKKAILEEIVLNYS